MATKATSPPQRQVGLGADQTASSSSPITLWPSLRQAASLLGVHPATLSRRHLPTEQYGQERRLSPTLVMELGDLYYRRRPVGELAAGLVEQARPQAHSLDELELVEADVERYLATRTWAQHRGAPDDDAWLAEAERRLPRETYMHVLEVLRTGRHAQSFRGTRFDADYADSGERARR